MSWGREREEERRGGGREWIDFLSSVYLCETHGPDIVMYV